jgi:hypothetical protein
MPQKYARDTDQNDEIFSLNNFIFQKPQTRNTKLCVPIMLCPQCNATALASCNVRTRLHRNITK